MFTLWFVDLDIQMSFVDLLGFSQNACPPAHFFSILPVYTLVKSVLSIYVYCWSNWPYWNILSNSQFQLVKHGFVLYIAKFFFFSMYYKFIQNAFIFHTLSQNFPTLSRVDPLFHASCLLISWFVLLLSRVHPSKVF